MSEIAVLWFNKIQMKDPFFWTSPVGPRELPLQLPFPPWAQLVEEVAALRLHRANATLGGVQYGVQADGAARCLLPWRTRRGRLAVGGTWVGRAARVSLAGIDPLGMRGGHPCGTAKSQFLLAKECFGRTPSTHSGAAIPLNPRGNQSTGVGKCAVCMRRCICLCILGGAWWCGVHYCRIAIIIGVVH